jgi:hypothetical protein
MPVQALPIETERIASENFTEYLCRVDSLPHVLTFSEHVDDLTVTWVLGMLAVCTHITESPKFKTLIVISLSTR